MRRFRQAKIVATLGPASSGGERIRALFEAGVDVFRLNFSHGKHVDHAARLEIIRALEKEQARPIGVLADLQGPKLRVGRFTGGAVELAAGAGFRFDRDPKPGDSGRVCLPHPEIFAALKPGAELLLDDGKLRLKVERLAGEVADCTVTVGGRLSDNKGVNVPRVTLPLTPLTDKDRTDLTFALDAGADWIALSFVQRPEDIAEARKLVAGRAAIMAKIEKPAAVDRLGEIVDLVDGIMVARGDLGVELPVEEVPGWQKRIVRAARKAGKPVIVATQMLESMISAPVPTRAEVSDVATAVYDGADAVMLSAESASGQYPVEAVGMMDRIVRKAERDPLYRGLLHAHHSDPDPTAPDAISAAARQVAETVGAKAIVCYTLSGSTALRAARERPEAAVIGLAVESRTGRRLSLVWGVHPVLTEDAHDFGDMVDRACRIARSEGFAKEGDSVVVTAGWPFGTPGATNVLRIAYVGKDGAGG
ncbi:MAG: pyruvate kinase [Alphaproteobacteria bacterium]|nr:pyruvate kinase [Alphaproteobacteria bacterium]